jgi:hypothetical protein
MNKGYVMGKIALLALIMAAGISTARAEVDLSTPISLGEISTEPGLFRLITFWTAQGDALVARLDAMKDDAEDLENGALHAADELDSISGIAGSGRPGISISSIYDDVDDIRRDIWMMQDSIMCGEVAPPTGLYYDAQELYADILDHFNSHAGRYTVSRLLTDSGALDVFEDDIYDAMLAEVGGTENECSYAEMLGAYMDILNDRLYDEFNGAFFEDVIDSADSSFSNIESDLDDVVDELRRNNKRFRDGDISRSSYAGLLDQLSGSMLDVADECVGLQDALDHFFDLLTDSDYLLDYFSIEWSDVRDALN